MLTENLRHINNFSFRRSVQKIKLSSGEREGEKEKEREKNRARLSSFYRGRDVTNTNGC